jgi:hypothetical protein
MLKLTLTCLLNLSMEGRLGTSLHVKFNHYIKLTGYDSMIRLSYSLQTIVTTSIPQNMLQRNLIFELKKVVYKYEQC